MKEKCVELESLASKYDSFNMHRKVREVAGLYRSRVPVSVRDGANKIISKDIEIKRTWQTYVAELFECTRADVRVDWEEPEGPIILKSKLLHAIAVAKDAKAAGEIHMELIKLINDENMEVLY